MFRVGDKVIVVLINNYPLETARDSISYKKIVTRRATHPYDSWEGEILYYDPENYEGKHCRPYKVSRPGLPDLWVTSDELFEPEE